MIVDFSLIRLNGIMMVSLHDRQGRRLDVQIPPKSSDRLDTLLARKASKTHTRTHAHQKKTKQKQNKKLRKTTPKANTLFFFLSIVISFRVFAFFCFLPCYQFCCCFLPCYQFRFPSGLFIYFPFKLILAALNTRNRLVGLVVKVSASIPADLTLNPAFTVDLPHSTSQFLLEILFLLLLRYVKYVSPMMVILRCFLVLTVPHPVNRTS